MMGGLRSVCVHGKSVGFSDNIDYAGCSGSLLQKARDGFPPKAIAD
jgi:hypothetical protein